MDVDENAQQLPHIPCSFTGVRRSLYEKATPFGEHTDADGTGEVVPPDEPPVGVVSPRGGIASARTSGLSSGSASAGAGAGVGGTARRIMSARTRFPDSLFFRCTRFRSCSLAASLAAALFGSIRTPRIC